MRICLTGDNHIGKQYNGHAAKERIAGSRLEALSRVVMAANENKCSLLVVSGDLFDRTQIDKSLISEVAKILAGFDFDVLVLPGNHDYYTPDVKLWQDFSQIIKAYGNITLLNRFEEYALISPDGEKITVYPAFCQSKMGEENNLAWIKSADIVQDGYRIGVAHGAISGLSQDSEGRYFTMTREELQSIPVDLWLIGHMHVPYPSFIDENSNIEGERIFNAGTHAQTDVSNNTEGCCFIVDIENSTEKTVRAKKVSCGGMRFFRLNISSEPEEGLEKAISAAVKNICDNSSVEIILKGTVGKEDYGQRYDIFERALSRFAEFEVNDSELSELISEKMIKDTYAETSLPAKALMRLLDDPKEAQMLFELLNECRE